MKHPPINLLVSYAYMRKLKQEQLDWIFGVPEVNWLLDCGAFTALNAGEEILLEDYMNFLTKWKDKLFGYIALDKLGDPKQTDVNLQIMLNKGFCPIPVHVRGDKQERMDYLFEVSNGWVALGGFRRPHRGPAEASYVNQKMLWARGRPVHWLGYTNLVMLNTFQPYSCDSSSFTSARRWGCCVFYNDKRDAPMNFMYEEFVTQHVPLWAIEVVEKVGHTIDDMRDPERWRRGRENNISSLVTCYSYLRYALDIEENLGTKYFMAITNAGMYEMFRAYYHITGYSYCAPERIPKCFM